MNDGHNCTVIISSAIDSYKSSIYRTAVGTIGVLMRHGISWLNTDVRWCGTWLILLAAAKQHLKGAIMYHIHTCYDDSETPTDALTIAPKFLRCVRRPSTCDTTTGLQKLLFSMVHYTTTRAVECHRPVIYSSYGDTMGEATSRSRLGHSHELDPDILVYFYEFLWS